MNSRLLAYMHIYGIMACMLTLQEHKESPLMTEVDTYIYLLKQQQAIAFCDLTAKNFVVQGYSNKMKCLQVRLYYKPVYIHDGYGLSM